jgi:ABC-type phosphate transport system substrate-binding protein
MTRMTRFAVTLVVTAGGVLAARSASAQDAGTTPTCASLTNPVYVTGSSAFEATLEAFAVKLTGTTETTPMTIVDLRPGSCAGVNTIATNADLTGTANYYTLNSSSTFVRNSCTLPASGQKADIAVSDAFYGSCGTVVPAAQPATLKDFPGPAQAIEFVVNKSNTATGYITAEEAQDLYGCGATANISTFTQAGGIFCRDANSGTQVVLCDNIGLSPATPAPPICVSVSGTMMPTSVAGYATASAAIGMLSADNYDLNRTTLGALAFKAFGQTKAFYTDSTSTARDRQNVRDGHYPIWGYEHLFAYVDTTGKPTSANAARLINIINGVVTDSGVGDYVALEATAGTIPVCAMGVKKTDDVPGYLSPTTATCSCGFVKAATGTAPAGCVPCGGASDGGADAAAGGCTGGKTCHSGFCE